MQENGRTVTRGGLFIVADVQAVDIMHCIICYMLAGFFVKAREFAYIHHLVVFHAGTHIT